MVVIPHPVAASAAARPDHPAIVAPQGTRTYRELAAVCAARAAAISTDWVDLGARRDLGFVEDLHAVGWAGAAARVSQTGPSLSDQGPPVAAADWALSDERLQIATSGTTGSPRPVRLNTHQLLFGAMGSAIRLGHLPGDRWLNCLPLHHIGGLAILYRCAWYGTTVVLQPRFDPSAVNAALDADATGVSLVPTMLQRVLDDRQDRPFPPHVRVILVGGAPMGEPLLERCRRLSLPVSLSWGMSEAGSQVATRFPGDLAARSAAALPFARVLSEQGRLVVEGPQVRGRLVSSDRGAVVDGQVSVHGRADDVIISGGENIDPIEIEQVLARHAAVRAVAVRGVPDERWGQRPVAWLVADPVSDDELDALCRSHLPGLKVPDRYVRIAALPRDGLGKLRRAALSEADDTDQG